MKKIETMSFQTVFELTAEDISTLILTALEGGSSYWIHNVIFERPEGHTKKTMKCYDIPLQGGRILVQENEWHKWYEVTEVTIQKGLNLLGKMTYDNGKRHKCIDRIVNRQYDAIDADIFLQLCLLRKVVFG